ncbi:hypothetical protein M433DRAFT_133703 [Acidomyces richmondensis BFW]|nr:MAG: hypothetical protein FE78DRAFT_346953 [Acidomyces sp. 'richmondensis']KYG46605.1 hypothetical protein M433DRAFT_133703 [Acidomyces richmondensis BFW]
MGQTVKLAEYLFTRLRQLQVDSIFGIPGDYNLQLLDYVEPQGLHWVGNCNELNAGYAADAYSRIKGLAALITTYGVGELSAINAIAGAYAERAPVVHIVGTPARQLQESRALIHHTLADGEYRHFADMARHVTVAQANLIDPLDCPQLIDRVIQQCLIHSRPVYIEVPADMVTVAVSAERLTSKIGLPEAITSRDEGAALSYVLERIYSSKRPAILVDGESRGFGILDEIQQLIKGSGWPTWTTVFGKSLVDETQSNVHGIWRGPSWSSVTEKEYFASADLIMCFGPHFSSTNSYSYSSIPRPESSVLFKSTTICANEKTFFDLHPKHFLQKLLGRLDTSKMPKVEPYPAFTPEPQPIASLAWADSRSAITQQPFYQMLNSYLRPGDIILAETGTAGHGCRDFRLPSKTVLYKPSTWLSIGYMLPAALGAALAQSELHSIGKWPESEIGSSPRTILLIGDGSLQMTVQEISTVVREKLDMLLILINNDGYTIERCLHGYDQQYNDIAAWNYLQAPALVGATMDKTSGYHAHTSRVTNWKELHAALDEYARHEGPRFTMLEVMMGKEDAPALLKKILEDQKAAAKAKNP